MYCAVICCAGLLREVIYLTDSVTRNARLKLPHAQLTHLMLLLHIWRPRLCNIRPYGTMAILDQAVAASDFISYLNSSPTPFHAVHSAKQRLTKAGFKEIKVHSTGT